MSSAGPVVDTTGVGILAVAATTLGRAVEVMDAAGIVVEACTVAGVAVTIVVAVVVG